MKTLIFIGMDVHKETTSLCSFDREKAEIFAEVKIPTKFSEILRYLENRAEEFNGECEFKIGYESGCLGTWLAEDLNTAGYNCVVMAASTIAKSTNQNTKKNDTNDAQMIAKALAWNQYSEVHLLNDEDKRVREYIRMRQDFLGEQKRSKQQLSAFLLRHNIRFESGKRAWTQVYYKWLHDLKLEDSMDQLVLDERLAHIEKLEEDIDRMNNKIDELAKEPSYQENTAKLGCFKGIRELTAMTILSECGDLNRFETAPQFTSYLGLIPSDYSSGNKTVHGSITKAGNKAARTVLIEATQTIVKGKGTKSKELKKRQKGMHPAIIAYADRGIERIRSKFFRMIKNGITYNKAIAACARELACFIWGILTNHIYSKEMNNYSQKSGFDPATGEVYAA